MASSAISQKDVPDKSDWYKETRTRVKQAELLYRSDAKAEWTRLESSYQIPPWEPVKREKTIPWNVESIVISATGIVVEQHHHLYAPTQLGRGGVRMLVESEFTWKTTFKTGQIKDIFVSEASRQSDEGVFIDVRFTSSEAPESIDATERVTTSPIKEDEVDEKGKNKAKTSANENMDDEEKGEEVEEEDKKEDDEEDEEEDETMQEDEPETAEYPLAKLFMNPAAVPGVEIRLRFRREAATVKGKPFRWIWPAVFYFLAGRDSWIPYTKVRETGRVYGFAEWKLDDQLSKKKDQGAAIFDKIAVENDPQRAMEWKLRPKPNLKRQSAARCGVIMSGLSLHPQEPAKRKRAIGEDDEDNDSELKAVMADLHEAQLRLQATGEKLAAARKEDEAARESWTRCLEAVQAVQTRQEGKKRKTQ